MILRNVELTHVVHDLGQLGVDDLYQFVKVLFVELDVVERAWLGRGAEYAFITHRTLGTEQHSVSFYALLFQKGLFVVIVLDDVELDVLRDSSLPELDVRPNWLLLNQLKQVVFDCGLEWLCDVDVEGRC